jgi:dihydropteroate synthase-like protein
MDKLLRILLITGEKSHDEIRQIAIKANKLKALSLECDVLKAPVDVSAFIQPHHVVKLCSNFTKSDYNFILIPGFTTWDTHEIADQISIPIYKGTRFSGDLLDLLTHIREIELPTKKAADYLLRNHSHQKIEKHIKLLTKVYSLKGQMKTGPRVLQFTCQNGDIILTGGKFPPLLIAEIVDCPKLSDIQIMDKIKYFVNSGAIVIDLGMIFGKSHPELIRRIVPQIKSTYDILVSVDSVQIEEIIAGIEAGVDMILSIDGENINKFLEYIERSEVNRDLGLVLVPLDGSSHKTISNPEEKAEFLISLAKRLNSYGFHNIMYDALLKSPISPGLMGSLYDYQVLHKKLHFHPKLHYPSFIGLHNVFELVDADSSGLITLLTLIARELECAGIFTTEFSPKTLGSIRDTKRSIELAYLAQISKSPPTNLGIDAFTVKSKRKSLTRVEDSSHIIDLSTDQVPQGILQNLIEQDYKFIHDSTGYFKFYVNHAAKLIEALFLPFENTKKRLDLKDSLLLKGTTAESIYKIIDKLGLIKEISHAFYVGKELSKAEYALHINAAYFEDTELE